MTYVNRPPGSPSCWGYQFSDADQECSQCSFRDTCRPTAINRHAGAPVQIRTMTPPQPPPSTHVPLPARPFVPAVQQPSGPPQPVYRQAPQPPAQQAVQYVQAPVQYQQQSFPAYQASIPDPANPNPHVPMMRPGSSGPPYYFCQYPGETVPQRLGKNMVLRGAESVFGELMFFFRHWTWPPHP